MYMPYNRAKERQTSEWLHIYAVTTLEKLFIAGSIQMHGSEAGYTKALGETLVSEAGFYEQRMRVLQNK